MQDTIEHKIDSIIVNANYDEINFDSLIAKYPENGYLIGMNIYCKINYFYEKFPIDSDSKLVKQYPNLQNNTYFLMGLGIIKKQNNCEDAIEYLSKSVEQDKNNENNWILLELYYYYIDVYEKDEEAIKYLDIILERNPYFIPALLEYSIIYIKTANYKEALKYINIAIESGENAYAYFQKGLVYYYLEDITNSKLFLQKSLNFKRNFSALITLGDIETSNGDYESAEKFYTEAMNIWPENSLIYSKLGYLNQYTEHLDSSLIYFKKAYDLDKTLENAMDIVHTLISNECLEEAKLFNNESIKKFGFVKETVFMNILIFSLEEKYDTAQNTLDEFYKVASEEDKTWIKSELKAWGINILPHP